MLRIQLECGCVPGESLCPRGQELQDALVSAYQDAVHRISTWECYDRARKRYLAHFKGTLEVEAVGEAPCCQQGTGNK